MKGPENIPQHTIMAQNCALLTSWLWAKVPTLGMESAWHYSITVRLYTSPHKQSILDAVMSIRITRIPFASWIRVREAKLF